MASVGIDQKMIISDITKNMHCYWEFYTKSNVNCVQFLNKKNFIATGDGNNDLIMYDIKKQR